MKTVLISSIALAVLLTACKTSTDPFLLHGGLPRLGFASRAGSSRKVGPDLTAEQLRLFETASGEYRLDGGDVVSLWAEDVAGLNRRFILGPDGKITVPGIGVVNLAGLTRAEAMKLVEDRLKANYRDPKVSLLIETYNNNRISILGEVQKPGEYNFDGSTSLLNVLAKAGGLTEEADLESCTIVRDKTVIAQIDLNKLLHKGNLSFNVRLLPNDSVYIRSKSPDRMADKRTFFVLGEVKDPGVFPTAVGADESMDPLRAISLAGGHTEDGDMARVRIIRRVREGPPAVTKVDLDDLLDGKQIKLPEVLPGDIVYVPRKGLATFR